MSINQKVFITGASKGIGMAIALEYHKRGYEVFLFARNIEALEQLTNFINSDGGRANYFAGDVGIKTDVQNAVSKANELMGRIDIAVLNAGISQNISLRNYEAANLENVLKTNLLGVAYCLEHVIPIMKKQKGGKIAGISSIASFRAMPGSSSYSISKIALDYLLESARIELKDLGIHVATCRFGFIRTDIIKKNNFYMPFILEPDVAARKIISGIENNRSKIQFPWIMVLITKIAGILPEFIYERIVKFRIKD